MKIRVQRRTVDLSAYPDLVVIYLGIHVKTFTGIQTLFGLVPKITRAAADKPDGLLAHEPIFFSLRHIGLRQYWRDFDALETWARSLPHKAWWQAFLSGSSGTGFWHETYFMHGGMEAVYDDVPISLGFTAFAPTQPAHGPMFSARQRLHLKGEATLATAIPEEDLADVHEP